MLKTYYALNLLFSGKYIKNSSKKAEVCFYIHLKLSKMERDMVNILIIKTLIGTALIAMR